MESLRTPVHWSEYFNLKDDIEIDSGTFRIYRRGVEGPLIFFIHGGGFSALTWAVLSKLLTSQIKCQCLAVDLRGHGDTKCTDNNDYSMETLSKDIIKIIFAMYPTEAPPIILVGHSLGGSIAVHVAHKKMIPSLAGLIVLDVVEGTALASLNSMGSVLASRPKSFSSLEEAINWSIQSRLVRNAQSARVSFPGQLMRISTGETATSELDKNSALLSRPNSSSSAGNRKPPNSSNGKPPLPATPEDAPCQQQPSDAPNSFASPSRPNSSPSPQPNYTWRIDLKRTEPFWKSWFQGLSKTFISVREPKLLILTDTDLLDTELMIGEKQGNFQLSIIPQCGHAIQEDVPDKVAHRLAHFLVRHRFTEAKSSCEL